MNPVLHASRICPAKPERQKDECFVNTVERRRPDLQNLKRAVNTTEDKTVMMMIQQQ